MKPLMKLLKYCVMMCVLFSEFLNFAVLAATTRISNSADCRIHFGHKYFYDKGTSRCEKCKEICENAEIMWTVDQCQTECKEYLTAQGCAEKEDKYYDEGLRTCASCSSICDNYEATGTIRTCRMHCSDYLDKLTPKQVPSRHKLNHLKALDGSELEPEQDSNSAHSLSHPGYITLMALGGLLVVCIGVGAPTYFYRTRQRQQYGQAPQEENEMQERAPGEAPANVTTDEDDRSSSQGRAVQPVEETGRGLSGPLHLDVATADLPLALADLQRV